MMSPAPTQKTPLWLDCDPGHDDVFAILFAAYHPGINLLGISTVFGNAPLETTTVNAASILTSIGKHNDIPIYAGASQAIARPPMNPPTSIHGKTGLDGTDLLPQPKRDPKWTESATAAMAAALLAQPADTAVVVATGPLTNIAILFRDYPQLAGHVKCLSLMGAAFGGGFTDVSLGTVDDPNRIGNYTRWAEFNIVADPEAAAQIFSDNIIAAKTTVIPLDLTHQVLATERVRDLLLYGKSGQRNGKAKTTLRQMLVELLMYFADTYADVFGITVGPPLHDPIAVAAALIGTPWEISFHDSDDQGSKQSERFSVTVETKGSYKDAVEGKTMTGMTMQIPLEPGSDGVTIPRSLDFSHFWTVLEDCIEMADEKVRLEFA
ncbi:uridine nucleosidase [Talaromyces proteolyticus]|uniref:Uridine nucleosidase n=1 Tax=Talaromyces proteolyticus TaxID=1131652 RepID=A0AAD4Q2J9_9EURO|nr:uridine nucleosidase [Talaromyces proteolyticus]KAH8700461.1 uridine nucleosidase [Talaromyces proteolyticus]